MSTTIERNSHRNDLHLDLDTLDEGFDILRPTRDSRIRILDGCDKAIEHYVKSKGLVGMMIIGEHGTAKEYFASRAHHLDAPDGPIIVRDAKVHSQLAAELSSALNGTLVVRNMDQAPEETQIEFLTHLRRFDAIRNLSQENRFPVRVILCLEPHRERDLHPRLFYTFRPILLRTIPVRVLLNYHTEATILTIIARMLFHHKLSNMFRREMLPRTIPKRVVQQMCRYEWPGNFSQLRAAITQVWLAHSWEVMDEFIQTEQQQVAKERSLKDLFGELTDIGLRNREDKPLFQYLREQLEFNVMRTLVERVGRRPKEIAQLMGTSASYVSHHPAYQQIRRSGKDKQEHSRQEP